MSKLLAELKANDRLQELHWLLRSHMYHSKVESIGFLNAISFYNELKMQKEAKDV